MNTVNINVTPDELFYLMKGWSLVENQEEERDAIMNVGLSKQAESPHYSDDLAAHAQMVKERDELLSNLYTKLDTAMRVTSTKQRNSN